jgi:hypothetical protein
MLAKIFAPENTFMGFATRSLLLLSTAMRFRALSREEAAPSVRVAHALPEGARVRGNGLPVEFCFRTAPLLCGFLFCVWALTGRQLPRVGVVLPEHFAAWLLVALGATWAARIAFRYRGEFQPAQVKDLEADQSVSQMRPRAVEIEGEIVGNAQPGSRWSPDLMLQDDTGQMFLFYRSSLPLGRQFFAFNTADRFVGAHVKVQGWYRRGTQPYIEISQIEGCVTRPTAQSGPILLFEKEGQRRRFEYEILVERSYSQWIQLQISAAFAAAGIIWLLGIY